MSQYSSGPPPTPTVPRPASTATLLRAQGLVLLAMAVASFVAALFVTWLADDVGGNGEGEGDVGAVKLYVGDLVEGAFLSLTFVFLVGALAALVVAAFLRRR